MASRPPLTSPDGSSNRNPPERCPRPLYSRDSKQEHHKIPREDQGENLFIKVKVKEENGMFDDLCKEDEVPLEISTDPGDSRGIQRDIKSEEEEEAYVRIKEEDITEGEVSFQDNTDPRDTQGSIQAETLAEGQMQNEDREIPSEISKYPGDTQRSIQAEKVAEGQMQNKDKEIPPEISKPVADRFTSPYFLPQFIDLYREESCLWKVKSKDYMNKLKRNNAYEKLVELCKIVSVRADVAYVKSKIANLRTVFKKELNKIYASQRSGATADDVYVPRLWYFESLRFLTDHEDACVSRSSLERSSSDSLSPMTDADNPEEITESQEQNCNTLLPASSAPYPKKRKRQDDITTKLLRQASAALQQKSDEYDDLCNMAAKKLRRMSDEQKHYAEILLLQLMNKGLRGELTPHTQLTDLANSYGPPVTPQTPQTQHPYWHTY